MVLHQRTKYGGIDPSQLNWRTRMKTLVFSILLLCTLALTVNGQNWPQFRGPGATGVVEGHTTPVNWNVEKSQNVAWKTEIPGLAHSSPVVWGNKIFYYHSRHDWCERRDPLWTVRRRGAGERRSQAHLEGLCRRQTDWKDSLGAEWLRRHPKVKRHPKSTHADSTPVRMASMWSLSLALTVVCLRPKRKILWKQDIGMLDSGWFYDPDYQWSTAVHRSSTKTS